MWVRKYVVRRSVSQSKLIITAQMPHLRSASSQKQVCDWGTLRDLGGVVQVLSSTFPGTKYYCNADIPEVSRRRPDNFICSS